MKRLWHFLFSPWRPIETAPHNKVVLAWWDANTIASAIQDDNGWWDAADSGEDFCTPKFWMPLPPSPTKEAKT